MNRRTVLGIVLTLLLMGIPTSVIDIHLAVPDTGAWTADEDGAKCLDAGLVSIPDAVDAASSGDDITVYPEVYAEDSTSPILASMKGMTLTSWSAEAYNSSDFDQSIANLAGMKVNWVTFTVFWFMETPTSTEMEPRLDLYTASDSSLVHAIQEAHGLEMEVALKPMVDVVDGTWRGQIQPTSWALWFDHYRNFTNHYAELAETNDVELLEVGTELRSSQPCELEWRQVISEVRTRFSGNLTYAANWDSYSTYASLVGYAVEFWDALDYIGVDAYFPLTDSYNPTVEQLTSAWSAASSGWWDQGQTPRNWTDNLYSTFTHTGKEIIFTEIGYCSQNGTNTKPWAGLGEAVDLQEQADCYQAALEVFKDKEWFEGWFWWNWETDPEAGLPGHPDYDWYPPQNKPAEDILFEYYSRSHNVALVNVTRSTDSAYVGEMVSITVVVENQGTFVESFSITTRYENTTLVISENIGTQEVLNLAPGQNATLVFIWNTTDARPCTSYTIVAEASTVPYEADTADNIYAAGIIKIKMQGDINGDGIVDIFDLNIACSAYGSFAGEPRYSLEADINYDGHVDMRDIIVIARNYGKTLVFVELAPIDPNLTSPSGTYRWLDAADQAYSIDYGSNYNYSQARVEVAYVRVGEKMEGTLTASNLKPNFAYQLKLVGTPDGSDNERIGLVGRWWQEVWGGLSWSNGQNLNNKGDGSSPNPNDLVYFERRYVENTSSPTGYHYRYTGYLVLDYFVTDSNGATTLHFETGSCYHVLWKTSQRGNATNDGPVKIVTFDPDPSEPAYDVDYPISTVSIFGEWERLPMGGVHLQPGEYNCQMILTEESFHGSGGSLAGNWAGAMSADIELTITD